MKILIHQKVAIPSVDLKPPATSNPLLFRTKLIIIATVILISVLIPATYGQRPSQKAPDFTLPVVGSSGLTGEKISLSLYRGRVVLLEFMEPSCIRCKHMAPILDGIYRQYEQQDVVFLSVAGPWNGATADDAAEFIRAFHSEWTYVYDPSGTTFNTFNITATPTIFMINAQSEIAMTYSGEVPASQLTADIGRFLQPTRTAGNELLIYVMVIIMIALVISFLVFSLVRRGPAKSAPVAVDNSLLFSFHP
jgi:thiol-disulfide isomerase/thioredoxin